MTDKQSLRNTYFSKLRRGVLGLLIMPVCLTCFAAGVAFLVLKGNFFVWVKDLVFPSVLVAILGVLGGLVYGASLTRGVAKQTPLVWQREAAMRIKQATRRKKLREIMITLGVCYGCAWTYVLVLYVQSSDRTVLLLWATRFFLTGLVFTVVLTTVVIWLTVAVVIPTDLLEKL